MTTIYAYDIDTGIILAFARGETNSQCEAKLDNASLRADSIGWTYTPEGLLETDETSEV